MGKILFFVIVLVISFVGYSMFKNRTIEQTVFVKDSEGKVVAKEFTKEYSVSSFIWVGKIMVPTTTTYPAKYSLQIVYSGKCSFFEVNKYTYEKYKEGDIIPVKVYRVDQFQRGVQIGSFEKFEVKG